MTVRKTIFLVAALLWLLVSCGPEVDDPDTDRTPRLVAVIVDQSKVVLEQGGSAQVPFRVEEPGFAVTELRLLTTKGDAPAYFALESFRSNGSPGLYVAVLADSSAGESYSEDVTLAVVQRNAATGNESLLSSEVFTVVSGVQDPGNHSGEGSTVATGLPEVFINTEGGVGIYSKEDYVTASMSISGGKSYPSLESVACSIRGRGNTTWEWPKKPYLVKLDSKESVLGMPKHKRWVLLANFMDRTLMRNLVSMHVASLTSLEWTPRCVPVELILNGKHMGSYLLIEQVRADKNRVSVEDGYLLELDFHYDNEIQWIDYHGSNAQMGSGVPFAIKYPDSDEVTTEQVDYIKDYISRTAEALYSSHFTESPGGYADFIDVDSFVDYWLVFEVMCNHELGNPGSVFMHKSASGLLTAGPCWDFDWGVLSFYTSHGDKEIVNRRAIWYARLFDDPAFKKKVKERFLELLPQLEQIPDYMDECEELLEESAKLNFKMWNPADDRTMNGGKIINGDENLSFHDAVQRLKNNYRTHLEVMSGKMESW